MRFTFISMIQKTHEGKSGGNIGGKSHADGGVQAVVVDDNARPVEIELNEVIICKKAAKKHWKTLDKINQSEGGAPIVEPKFEKGATVTKLCPEGTEIQTLLFEKKKFTEAKAKKWAEEHGFENSVDAGLTIFRMRQEDPNNFIKKKFKTIKLKDGVLAVIGCHKEVEKKLFGGNIDGSYFVENINDSGYKWKISTEKIYSLCDTNKPLPLSSIIEHKEFFNKYPKAKKILVYFKSIKDVDKEAECELEKGTSYGLSKICVGLHLNFYKTNSHEKFTLGKEYSEFSKESCLLHEIQHICQFAEGKATGRSYNKTLSGIGKKLFGGRSPENDVSILKESEEIAEYQYKNQIPEQEAMLCVYKWLKQKGLDYTNKKFINVDLLRHEEQTDSQKGFYSEGSTIKSEVPIKVIEAYESWNDPKSTITSGQARKTLSDFAIELQAQGKIKIYSYGNAHIHALNWLDENHNAEEFSKGGIFKSTNKTNKNEINDIISGVNEVSNGKPIQATASYIRRIKGASHLDEEKQSVKNKEANQLKKYAKENNLWIEKIEYKKEVGFGKEHEVFFYDEKTVVKLNNGYFYDYWLDYLNSLLIHNYFFPETAYELVGFTQREGILLVVVRQELIKATEPTELEIAKDFLLKRGFVRTSEVEYKNEELGIMLIDIHDQNVIINNKIPYFIDTVFYIKENK